MTSQDVDREIAETPAAMPTGIGEPTRRRTLIDWATEREVVDFLLEEAQVLDEQRFDEWLEMLATDVLYQVPIRSTRPPGQQSEFSNTMFHFDEDIVTLRLRVERLKTGDAWAEVPPSRTRHFLSNFRVFSEAGRPDHFRAFSNVLLTRSRGDEAEWHMLGGSRQDLVRRRENGSFELVDRTVFLDATTLPTYNLAFFM